MYDRAKFITLFLLGCLLLSSCTLQESATTGPVQELPAAPPPMVPQPAPTTVPEPPPAVMEESLQHQNIPGELPEQRLTHAGDHDSSTTSSQRRAPGGDKYVLNSFERPFNAETMDIYYPNLDIQEMQVLEESPWLFVTITVKGGAPAEAPNGRYGVELDLDMDGRGDWLVLVFTPGTGEWTTDGVQVWQDANKDVGGPNPGRPDADPGNLDGYELSVFDGGRGDDPDLAWMRLDPNDPNTVQIAFKEVLTAGDPAYSLGVWAGADLDPARFKWNDHVTQDEAGSPLIEYENDYPIKKLAALDSACRVTVGFQPTGTEIGVCGVADPDEGICKAPPRGCPNGHWSSVRCMCVP